MNNPAGTTMLKKCLAWCVHGYTALGLVAAAGIVVALIDGQPDSYRYAFLLMFAATVIDATDGTLARAVKVKEVLPGFDGRRLDDLIDFQTYTTLPLMLIWRANLLDGESAAWLLAPLLASAYGFCQTNVKTEDGYFLGFPSYWNIIAFYLYVLQPPGWLTLGLLLFFAILTFVPARYLYPSHRGRLNRWTCWLGAVWSVLVLGVLLRLPDADGWTRVAALASLVYPAFYLIVSWAITVRIVFRARRQHGTHSDRAASASGSLENARKPDAPAPERGI
jgi:phosphatidylcholine synthase